MLSSFLCVLAAQSHERPQQYGVPRGASVNFRDGLDSTINSSTSLQPDRTIAFMRQGVEPDMKISAETSRALRVLPKQPRG